MGHVGGGLYISSCVFYSNGGDGLNLDEDCNEIAVHESVFLSNGAYGINFNSSTTILPSSWLDYNSYFNNTSGATDLATPGTANSTADPEFVDAAGGDFTPGAGSPLIGTGVAGNNIGVVAHAEGGGGGGPVRRIGGVLAR
jgi:hypothetical protein